MIQEIRDFRHLFICAIFLGIIEDYISVTTIRVVTINLYQLQLVILPIDK